MTIGVDLEPFIILLRLLFSIFLLVIIDRIGTIRGTVDDEEEESNGTHRPQNPPLPQSRGHHREAAPAYSHQGNKSAALGKRTWKTLAAPSSGTAAHLRAGRSLAVMNSVSSTCTLSAPAQMPSNDLPRSGWAVSPSSFLTAHPYRRALISYYVPTTTLAWQHSMTSGDQPFAS